MTRTSAHLWLMSVCEFGMRTNFSSHGFFFVFPPLNVVYMNWPSSSNSLTPPAFCGCRGGTEAGLVWFTFH